MKWAFGIAMGLLAVGLLLGAVAPGSGGYLLVIPAAIILGAILFAVYAMARRSPGWTRVVNPGAAHREAMAEFAARKHAAEPVPGQAPEPGPTERDERGG
jgi:hypothetical protein